MSQSRQPNAGLSRRRVMQFGVVGAIGATTRWLGASKPEIAFGQAPHRPHHTGAINVRDFGAIGDGSTDESSALQAAIRAAAEAKRTLYFPPGEYVVTQSLRAASNLAIWAYDATLLTMIGELGDSGRIVPTLNIDSVDNVTVSGLAVNGQKSSFSDTEYKAGIGINNSSGVTIEDCDLFDCKGDGLICYSKHEGQRNRNIVVKNSICRSNYRLGCAITDLTLGRFFNCVFTQSFGTLPMAGVDLEPDSASAWISDIEFHQCDFSENGSTSGDDGAGIQIYLHEAPTNPQGGIHFYECAIHDNMIMGAILFNSRDIGFHDCQIVGNGSAGITIAQTSESILVESGLIASNMMQGITAIRDTGHRLTGLEVRGVMIENNSQVAPDAFDGIQLSGNCHDILIESNTITGSHRYGVWVDSSVTSVKLVGNDLNGNAIGPVYPPSLVNTDPDTMSSVL